MTDTILLEPAPTQEGGYNIRFEPCRRRVRVECNGVWLADSLRAIVLHETRAPPAYYIPLEDVHMDYLEKTQFLTFCPFKGNASHWTLNVGGKVAENAAWAYENPHPDAEPIRGYLSFERSSVAALYEGDEETAISIAGNSGPHANPIAAWLIEQAWKAVSAEDLMEQFCRFLHAAGYPLARSTVIIPTLHPQVFAMVLIWREDSPTVQVVFEPHDILSQPKYADSPFAPIIRGSGGVRRRLEDSEMELDFPIVRDLHDEGATDYLAMPFRFSDGQINVVSMTSFTKGGFSVAQLGSLYEILPALGRMFEVHAQRRIAVSLLDTYLGRSTGKCVLDGQIKLGDGQMIHAVITFADLRDSTQLAERMETGDYLRHLNRFFAAMAGAIIANGGEILSYIGDAVLAIFPFVATEPSSDASERLPDTAVSAEDACARAIAATREAALRVAAANTAQPDLPPVHYGIGLHVGDVTYGNIGIPERLQFTVIGPATNEASRIQGMTKELGEPVVVSAKFADHYSSGLVSKGFHVLKGVRGTHELFALR